MNSIHSYLKYWNTSNLTKVKNNVLKGLILIIYFGLSACSDNNEFVKLTPELLWENPKDIGVGVPLSDTQLNATADVAGTYVYAPELGSLLDIGADQELTVEFTPKYPTAFNSVVKSVFINVVDKGSSEAVFNEMLTYGTVADIDGNAYKTIEIGDQTWMAQNLRTTRFRNGDVITNVTSNSEWVDLTKEAYSSYNNSTDLDYLATFGFLYNWYAVSDTRNIAPEGWHVATQEDWDQLINTVGGVEVAGQKLKEAGNSHWNNSGSQGTNEYGFTALPSGRRQYTDGTFINTGFNGFWWANTANGADFSFYYQMNFDTNSVIPANFLRAAGYSVRCVKD